MQGVIVTVLALAYFVMADVSVAFFLLGALTIAVRDHVYADVCRGDPSALFPTGPEAQLSRAGRDRWHVVHPGVGFLGVAFSFLVGFFPPTQLPVGSPALYVGLVLGGTVVFTGLPLLIGMLKQKSWRTLRPPGAAATNAV